jgi:hypothetical protein
MSVWSRASEARREEGSWAAIGVARMQRGEDPSGCFERAAAFRAERYEFEATGDIVQPLVDARNAALWPHIRSFRMDTP